MNPKREEKAAVLKERLQILKQEIEVVRKRTYALLDQGHTLSSPEVVQEAKLCGDFSGEYLVLEKEYRQLRELLETACSVASDQTIEEMDRLIHHIREEINFCGETSLIYPAMGKRTDAQFKLLLMEYLTLQANYMERKSDCLSLLAQLDKDKINDLYDLDQILPSEKQVMAFSWAIREEQARRDKEAVRRT